MNFWINQDFCPSVGFKLTDTFYCCLAWKPRALIGTERMDWGSNWHDSTPGGHRPCTRPVEAEVIHPWLSRWDLKIGLLLKSDFEVGPISAEDWVALKISIVHLMQIRPFPLELNYSLHRNLGGDYICNVREEEGHWRVKWNRQTENLGFHIFYSSWKDFHQSGHWIRENCSYCHIRYFECSFFFSTH